MTEVGLHRKVSYSDISGGRKKTEIKARRTIADGCSKDSFQAHA